MHHAVISKALDVKDKKIFFPKNPKVAWAVRDITDVTLVSDDGQLVRAYKHNKL